LNSRWKIESGRKPSTRRLFANPRLTLASNRFTFDPIAVLKALADAAVEFVLIGGVAQGAHGSAYPTYDVDVAVLGSRANVERLRKALTSLRVGDGDVERGGIFETDAGAVDVTTFPARSLEYRRLEADAMRASVANREIRIASIDHLIAMRERRNRPYDPLLSLELRALSDERLRQS
jgi:hypothetical protein